jgi:excisionase family DNA binding protein
MDTSLLTAQDVAAMLGVPASWVYSQTRAGHIPTVRLGRYYRYRREVIAAWVEGRES